MLVAELYDELHLLGYIDGGILVDLLMEEQSLLPQEAIQYPRHSLACLHLLSRRKSRYQSFTIATFRKSPIQAFHLSV
jgi:hypothetical protein